MAVRDILRMGHPLLRRPALTLQPEQIQSPWLDQLLDDMQDTLAEAGGIGLAAPQIGEPYQVAIITIEGGATRYGMLDAMPLRVYINPQIRIVDETKQGFYEGCLSVPGLRGFVERPRAVEVAYQNQAGEPVKESYQAFLATVVQHELDHLDGRLYVDRMTDMSTLCFESEFEQFVAASAA